MDWTQTLTIILTIGALAAALTAALWHLSKEDMKLVREDMKRHDEEFSKRDNLWATLLQEIPHDRAKNYLNQSLGMGRAFFERFLIFLSLVLFFSLNLKRLIFFGQKKTF